jgi:amino acid transporter
MSQRTVRGLGTLGLVFIMYFQVSGGPLTLEALVAQAGPGMALLVLCVLPLTWAVPEALLIGELASMLPEEGGYYAWVKRAFGPFRAFQNAWITWCYSLVHMAIYPLLFTQALAWFAPGLDGPVRWIAALAMIWIATALNLRGVRPVGGTATAIGVFVIAAFGTLVVVSLPRMTHVPWRPFTVPGTSALGGAGGRAVAGVVELHWLGQRKHGIGRSARCRPHASAGVGDSRAAGGRGVSRDLARYARRQRLDDMA